MDFSVGVENVGYWLSLVMGLKEIGKIDKIKCELYKGSNLIDKLKVEYDYEMIRNIELEYLGYGEDVRKVFILKLDGIEVCIFGVRNIDVEFIENDIILIRVRGESIVCEFELNKSGVRVMK